jgi:uncharacterized membrane protein YhaH (DUF805 family)
MEEIQKAVKTCFNKYAEFNGRADRSEFWWFVVFQLIVMAITGMVSRNLNGVAGLALLLPGLAVGARRLHDIGKTAWLLLVGFIPVIGLLLLIYWCAQPSDGPNAYGSPGAGSSPEAPPVTPPPGQQ